MEDFVWAKRVAEMKIEEASRSLFFIAVYLRLQGKEGLAKTIRKRRCKDFFLLHRNSPWNFKCTYETDIDLDDYRSILPHLALPFAAS
jgi:hypothetical protein